MLQGIKTTWRDTSAPTRLWICATGLGLIYLSMTAPFQLSRLYAVSPPVDYAKLTHHSITGFVAYLVAIVSVFGLYLVGLRTLVKNQSQGDDQIKPSFFWISGLLFGLILTLSYPQTAIDMLVYALRSRGWGLYELSPFLFSPEALPSTDPWLGLAGEWADAASPYGPLWEWISLGAFYLSGGNFLTQLFLIKIIGLLAYMASAIIIFKILGRFRPQWALIGLAFFAWNPLVLLESVQNAHNDILMVFFILAAIRSYFHLVEKLSFWPLLIFIGAFVASVMVKFITLLVLPFFLLGLGMRQTTWGRRILLIILIGVAVGVLCILMMVPYWPGWDHWAVLQAGKGAGRSVTAIMVLGFRTFTESTAQAFDLTNGLIYVLFGSIYLWGLWRTVCRDGDCFRGTATQLQTTRETPILISFYIFFWYALFVAPVFHAWYLLWCLPLAALSIPNIRVMSGALVFSLVALLIIPYYETVRVWIPTLNQNHLLGHAIGVPILLLLVLLSVWKPIDFLKVKFLV